MGTTGQGDAKPQTIVVGPVAAFVPIKMLGTNGGGFYGMNSAHPLENPTAATNILTTLLMMIFPMALVLMYGRMLGKPRHAVVLYAVMLVMLISLIGWSIYWDTVHGNPAPTARPVGGVFEIPGAAAAGGPRVLSIPAVAGLPVDQHLGNLEGKEPRFGTSAGATFAAITTTFTCGAVNCERRHHASAILRGQLHVRRRLDVGHHPLGAEPRGEPASGADQSHGERVGVDADHDALDHRPRRRDGALAAIALHLSVDVVGGAAQRQLAERDEVALAEEIARGLARPLGDVHVARRQATPEILRGQIDQLDLVGLRAHGVGIVSRTVTPVILPTTSFKLSRCCTFRVV